MEALEEVFDKATLMIIYGLLNRGIIKRIFGVVKAGKEARIYWAKGPEERDIAVKIYLTTSAQFRKGRQQYMEGDVRFGRTRRDTRSIVYQWAAKEFKNLEAAYRAGVSVPKPVRVQGNVLLMEFVGEGGAPLPLLKEVSLADPLRTYYLLLENLRLLYQKAELVHGDFSEYNVMVSHGEPILFDLAQAVHRSHPMSEDFLRRDIRNLNNYFVRLGIDVPTDEEVYKKIVG